MSALGWNDKFYYGVFSGHKVVSVFSTKPSYLVWTCVNTRTKFDESVMIKLRDKVARGPTRDGMTRLLIRKFNDEVVGGPW